jgi:predicted methyltransferase
MPDAVQISDKALAVFAFAIYHQLESGSRVTQVIQDDGAGHHADPDAIAELERLGLVSIENDRVGFTQRGEAMIDHIVATMRSAATTDDR